ncbi:MAG TPA: ABC transporter permease, partial [Bacillota bacterium]|nr:ABC transporter permease [Bacillota bacterium]
MNKFWTVLSHTYMTKVKTKSFIISTIITLLFIFGIANIQTIIDMFSNGEDERVAVMDKSGELYKPFEATVEATGNTIQPTLFEGGLEAGKKAVEDEEYEALLVVDLNDEQVPKATLYMDSVGDSGLKDTLQEALQQLKVTIATQNAGVDEEQLQAIYSPVSL